MAWPISATIVYAPAPTGMNSAGLRCGGGSPFARRFCITNAVQIKLMIHPKPWNATPEMIIAVARPGGWCPAIRLERVPVSMAE